MSNFWDGWIIIASILFLAGCMAIIASYAERDTVALRLVIRVTVLAPVWPLAAVGVLVWAIAYHGPRIYRMAYPRPLPARDPILQAAQREVDAIAPEGTDGPV